MMTIEIHPLPAFEDNYIWALQVGDAVAVVDPGESAPVTRHLDERGAHLAAILVTHRHGDHTEGIAALLARWPVPVFGPAREAVPGVTQPLAGGERIRLPELDIEFEVIAVPGHTRGHVAYYACAGPPQGGMRPPVGGSEPDLRAWGAIQASAGPPQGGMHPPVGGSEPGLRAWGAIQASAGPPQGVGGSEPGLRAWGALYPGTLFCGDVLFGAGCGRVFEGTMDEMQSSLARLTALPPDTLVYCAHEYTESCLRFAGIVEPDNAAIAARSARVAQLRAAQRPSVPSTLAEELATNPFLRWDAPAVIAAAGRRRGRPAADAGEVFAAIREWKNNF